MGGCTRILRSHLSLPRPWYRSFSSTASSPTPTPGTPYAKLTIGVPKEIWHDEKRVAIVPAVVTKLVKKGFTVNIEENAGTLANFTNKAYEEAGAKVTNVNEAFQSDIILKVRPTLEQEVSKLKNEGTLISFLYPAQNKTLIEKLAAKKINAFAMDCIPRISRAQAFDALSSMANVAGYRAVIEAAAHFPRFFSVRSKIGIEIFIGIESGTGPDSAVEPELTSKTRPRSQSKLTEKSDNIGDEGIHVYGSEAGGTFE
ncbi:NAD(P) transhydrogenase, mitochondrial [Eumeta japonica]|uniref:proton-translocating NAD(P)(+) transhydrogenase n=1 Tax=Eumeta variegata TaxID=151549 RepID=A0A4C1UYX7_EUMVA|nr:NAD(P) transhydrogenase, mitochondrial [Eumeta japonica]